MAKNSVKKWDAEKQQGHGFCRETPVLSTDLPVLANQRLARDTCAGHQHRKRGGSRITRPDRPFLPLPRP
ncbi:MAG: hypothetical protein ACO3F9_12290 [Burkholderiales bacterium]